MKLVHGLIVDEFDTLAFSWAPASHTSRYPASLPKNSTRPTGSFRWGWLLMSVHLVVLIPDDHPEVSMVDGSGLRVVARSYALRPNVWHLSGRHPVPDPLSRQRLYYPGHVHVRPGLVVVDHRICDGRRAVPRQRWSRPDWRATTGDGTMAPGMEPPTARLNHSVNVLFGPLNPISFLPWLFNGPIGPKGLHPNPKEN